MANPTVCKAAAHVLQHQFVGVRQQRWILRPTRPQTLNCWLMCFSSQDFPPRRASHSFCCDTGPVEDQPPMHAFPPAHRELIRPALLRLSVTSHCSVLDSFPFHSNLDCKCIRSMYSLSHVSSHPKVNSTTL